MKSRFYFIALLAGFVYEGAVAQTLYVPGGTGGIGATTSGNTNVGINTTNAPLQKLTVVGQGLFLPSTAQADPGDGAGAALRIGYNSTNDYGYINANQTGVWYRSLIMQINGGPVAIGTASPDARLDIAVTGAGTTNALRLRSGNPTNTSTNRQVMLSYGNTVNYSHVISTRHDSGNTPGNSIDFYTWKVGDGSANPGTNHVMSLNGGKVGIGGVLNPTEMLTVNGKVLAEEVQVVASVPVPDYVFADDYSLPSLETLRSYIKQHHHLPEVPSAKEIEKDGILLGEMNLLLLKKIEEMTLYMLELKDENEKTNKRLMEVEKELANRK